MLCLLGYIHLAALIVPFLPSEHNNIRDFTALILSEVRHDIKIEHYLQLLTGENLRYKTVVCDGNAHLDICADFWGSHHQHAFFLCTCV